MLLAVACTPQQVVSIASFSTESASSQQGLALQPEFQDDLSDLAAAPHYNIDARVDLEDMSVDGQVSVSYVNRADEALSEIVFRLLPNAASIYGGGSLSVNKVTRAGQELDFELTDAETAMRVPLEPKLAPGDTSVINIEFTAQVPVESRQGYGIFNYSRGVTSLSGWYPIVAIYDEGWQTPGVPAVGDAMWAEISLYDVKLSVPAGIAVVSTGAVVDRKETEGRVEWHMVSGPAREFTVAMSDRFQRQQTQVGDVTLNYYTLPHNKPVTPPDTALTIAANAFQTYVDHFGPYPFTEFDLVEADVNIGGYEFSGMVSVDYNLRVHGGRADFRYIVAHEVAHQWWYLLVGNNQVRQPWLDESFAAYGPSIYLEETAGTAAAESFLASWREAYGTRSASEPAVDSSALAFSGWTPYRTAVYVHGAFFLDALRQEMGDAKFFTFVQHLQKTYRYRTITTTEFFAEAEEVAGRDLDPLFAQWFGTS